MSTKKGPVSIHCKVMKRFILLASLLAVSGCGGNDSPNTPSAPPTTSAPYSQTDLVVGTGATVANGSAATIAYTGWLHNSARPDNKGTQFDSNVFGPYVVGSGRVIAGWERGIPGMRVGGQRRLVIPPELAYGNNSPDPSRIPQNATLVFDVTLNAVQ
jgi:FKBP-type peptidyl-prolyl cis-trans isomerase FkpA